MAVPRQPVCVFIGGFVLLRPDCRFPHYIIDDIGNVMAFAEKRISVLQHLIVELQPHPVIRIRADVLTAGLMLSDGAAVKLVNLSSSVEPAHTKVIFELLFSCANAINHGVMIVVSGQQPANHGALQRVKINAFRNCSSQCFIVRLALAPGFHRTMPR